MNGEPFCNPGFGVFAFRDAFQEVIRLVTDLGDDGFPFHENTKAQIARKAKFGPRRKSSPGYGKTPFCQDCSVDHDFNFMPSRIVLSRGEISDPLMFAEREIGTGGESGFLEFKNFRRQFS